MKKQEYKQDIQAPAAKVYDMMLGLTSIETYEQWTAEFNPTSTYEGNWQKGTKMYFVGTDENGKKGGMVSEIAENIPNQLVSIRHIGMLDGDKEITSGPEIESWAGGLENYAFNEKDGITTVTIEIDIAEDFQDYFDTAWPKALQKLRQLVEQKRS